MEIIRINNDRKAIQWRESADSPINVFPFGDAFGPEPEGGFAIAPDDLNAELAQAMHDYTPPPTPLVVPFEADAYEVEKRLVELGHDVDAVINALPDGPKKTLIKLKRMKRTTYRRNSPDIALIATAFSLTAAAVDDIFTISSHRAKANQ